jgi:prepilin-type N-terminal cleavage/methylation domain-containing protein/prepilin-type processing-associated H-X9-DG protein
MTKRRGFTLIELLVVIAIIAILAGILIPVYARTRENARRTSCQNNFKQLYLAFQQYIQDSDERFPLSATIGPPTTGGLVTWSDAIQPYVKDTKIFHCPSLSALSMTTTEQNLFAKPFTTTTVFNARLAGLQLSKLQVAAETGLAADGGISFSGETWGVPNRSVRVVGGTDARFGLWTRTLCGINNMFPEFPNSPSVDPILWFTGAEGTCQRRGGVLDIRFDPTFGSAANIHNNGGNYLFADGHVKFLKYNARPHSCLDHNPPYNTNILRFCPDRQPDQIEAGRNVWTSPWG